MIPEENLFKPSDYLRASDVKEALKYFVKYADRAKYIAGGTDILMEKDPTVKVLIDINHLNLNYIRLEENQIRIGSTTSFSEIINDDSLVGRFSGCLKATARSIGLPQIRNIATVGGNICYAAPCADMGTMLLTLDATLNIVSLEKERNISLEQFFKDVRQCDLKNEELVTEIQVPLPEEKTEAQFSKSGRVSTGDLALVNAAVRLSLDETGNIVHPRIALGAVAPVPLRAKKAEQLLVGQKPTPDLINKVAEQAAQEMTPISDIRASAEYRYLLCRISVADLIKELWHNLNA